MTDNNSLLPIGVFDSGFGGISVLAELIQELPAERFIYLADSANAPYGTKSCDCVRELSTAAAKTMLVKGVKALVVACNTATSVAIKSFREEFSIPVIGMEPALKPAVEAAKDRKIIVMATPLTLKEEKFNNLYHRFNGEAQIIRVPCPGLVELIENDADHDRIIDYLKHLFKDINLAEISAIVLGCTHYCFIRKEVRELVGGNVLIVDGNAGTARHVKALLEEKNLLKRSDKSLHNPPDISVVEFMTTGESEIVLPMCQKFLVKYMEQLNKSTID